MFVQENSSCHKQNFVTQKFQCYVTMYSSAPFDLTIVVQESDRYPFQTDIKYNLSFSYITPCGGILVSNTCFRTRRSL